MACLCLPGRWVLLLVTLSILPNVLVSAFRLAPPSTITSFSKRHYTVTPVSVASISFSASDLAREAQQPPVPLVNHSAAAAPPPPSATTTTTTTSPVIELDGVKNMRDLSSVSRANIKAGRVYRTGFLSKASPSDVYKLREELKLRTLIDLRSQKELRLDEEISSSVYDGFETWSWARKAAKVSVRASDSDSDDDEARQRHFISVMDEMMYTRGVFKRLPKRQKAAALFLMTGGAISKRARRRARGIFLQYINDGGLPLLNELLLTYSASSLCKVLELIADPTRHPIGIYCTAGKDRTGLVVMLVLSALGVDREAILADYVLSDSAYEHLDDKAMVGALEQHNLDPQKFLRAPGFVVEATLSYIERRYGSVLNYLDSIGFTADKREQLRKALTE